MTLELWVLLASAGVLMVGLFAQGIAGLMAYGPIRQSGARDEALEQTRFLGRTSRAAQNQIESLALITPVILIAHLVGTNTAMTEMGSLIYLVARLVYMPVYWLGIPFIRTMIFTAGLVGIVMIAASILMGQ
jgi:uncharacterized MAPEG superfamily protein